MNASIVLEFAVFGGLGIVAVALIGLTIARMNLVFSPRDTAMMVGLSFIAGLLTMSAILSNSTATVATFLILVVASVIYILRMHKIRKREKARKVAAMTGRGS